MTNPEKKSALIGMILGDGSLTKRDTLTIKHCEKQKEYIFFKSKILQLFHHNQMEPKKINNSGYPGWVIWTRKTPMYRILRKKMYKNGIKTISRDILNRLTALGIAIWFMDDGSTTFVRSKSDKIKSVTTFLHTYLSREENEIIQTYFKEVWDINFNINPSKGLYRLRLGTKEGRKFAKIISPYIIPCMQYKINKLVLQDNAPRKEEDNIVCPA